MLKNIEQVKKNITDQIMEAQLKLGFVKETVRFYYPLESLNALLGTSYEQPQTLCEDLGRICSSFDFCVHQGRIEVSVPADYVEYVHREVPASPFLKTLIELFQNNHLLELSQIKAVFGKFGSYVCQNMPEGADFDYVIYFDDQTMDEYYYCIKMEMGHTIYHRFTKSDYQKMI